MFSSGVIGREKPKQSILTDRDWDYSSGWLRAAILQRGKEVTANNSRYFHEVEDVLIYFLIKTTV